MGIKTSSYDRKSHKRKKSQRVQEFQLNTSLRAMERYEKYKDSNKSQRKKLRSEKIVKARSNRRKIKSFLERNEQRVASRSRSFHKKPKHSNHSIVNSKSNSKISLTLAEKGRLRREHYSKMSFDNQRDIENKRHVLDGGRVYASNFKRIPQKVSKSRNRRNERKGALNSQRSKSSYNQSFKSKKDELVNSGMLVNSELFDSFNNSKLKSKVPQLDMNKVRPIKAPLNSNMSLKDSERTQQYSQRSSRLKMNPYSERYGNIVSTRRSRKKSELAKTKQYFQLEKSRKIRATKAPKPTLDNSKVYEDEESLIIELQESGIEYKEIRNEVAGRRRQQNLFQKQKKSSPKSQKKYGRSPDIDYCESSSDISSNYSSRLTSAKASRKSSSRVLSPKLRQKSQKKKLSNQHNKYRAITKKKKTIIERQSLSPFNSPMGLKAPASPQTQLEVTKSKSALYQNTPKDVDFVNRTPQKKKGTKKKKSKSSKKIQPPATLKNTLALKKQGLDNHFVINAQKLNQMIGTNNKELDPLALENILEVENESDVSEISIALTSPLKSYNSPLAPLGEKTLLSEALSEIEPKCDVKIPQNALFSNKLIFHIPEPLEIQLNIIEEPIQTDLMINGKPPLENFNDILKQLEKIRKRPASPSSEETTKRHLESLSSLDGQDDPDVPQEIRKLNFGDVIQKVHLH